MTEEKEVEEKGDRMSIKERKLTGKEMSPMGQIESETSEHGVFSSAADRAHS